MGTCTILEFFQSEGKIVDEREELKIRERGSEILGAVLWSMIEEIPSGPEAVSIGIQEMRLQVSSGCRDNMENCFVVRDRDREPEEIKRQLTC